MYKKLGLGLFYLAAAALIYLYGDDILGWFRETRQVGLVILMATLMALFPVIPYPVIGGIIGAAFGPLLGGAITWTGSTAASLLMFLFFRYGYQDWGTRMLQRYSGIGKITAMFERSAFLAIVFARMIPILPSFAVNIYSALSRVSFGVYAVASALGKLPAMLLFATLGDSLMTEPRHMLTAVGVYAVFLALMVWLHRWWGRRQRTVE